MLGVKVLIIMVWMIMSPVIRYQSVLKSEYFPLSKVRPYYYKLAFESMSNHPVFKKEHPKIPRVIS